jgi:hypothetical protein
MYLGWAEQGKLAAWFGLCRAELSISLGILLGSRLAMCIFVLFNLFFSYSITDSSEVPWRI